MLLCTDDVLSEYEDAKLLKAVFLLWLMKNWHIVVVIIRVTREKKWSERSINMEDKYWHWFTGRSEVHEECLDSVRTEVSVWPKKMSSLHKLMRNILRQC